jgi:hypothetical protein
MSGGALQPARMESASKHVQSIQQKMCGMFRSQLEFGKSAPAAADSLRNNE